MSFDAVLIAGGRSTRFGEDKAFVDWKGRPLYAHQLQMLASLRPTAMWLSTNAEQPFPQVLESVSRLVDEEPDQGPIGGLVSVFRESKADRILVLGVDLPCMSPEYLNSLLDFGTGVVPHNGDFWEPLAAVYPRKDMLALLENHLSQGNRKLQSVLHEAFDAGLITRLAIGPDEEPLFQNINTQEDLEALSPSVYDRRVEIARFNREEDQLSMEGDFVAAEEPLEIRVNEKSVAVMMRTPGNDDELAAGFLVTEGMATSPDEILEIAQCPDVDPQGVGNTLEVRMSSSPDLEELTRHVFTSSSCGVCGKATIDAVFLQFPPVIEVPPISADYLLGLPGKLRAAQKTFDRTGGLHASALFDADGNLLMLREDVGRHNALDKVIGRAFLDGKDLSKCVLLVSGRISFELMQKALAARIPAVAGISAPSSLAVQLAKESGQFLAGFVRGKSFNVYSGKIEK